MEISRWTIQLGETFLAFAIDPKADPGELITRALEAAIAWDTREASLVKAGLVPESLETKRNSDVNTREKRVRRK